MVIYTMNLSAQFNHFIHALWVDVQCEASKAMPAVAEASEATCKYVYTSEFLL